MQTSFKKCLSLKHVWPPFLDFRDLGFFFFSFPFFLSQMGEGSAALPGAQCWSRWCWQQYLGLHPEWEVHAAPCQRETWLCQTATFCLLKVRQRRGRSAATTFLRAAVNMETDLRGTQKCTGFVWPGFGSVGATGVAAVRSCQQAPYVQQCQWQLAARRTRLWPRLGQAEMVATPPW